MRDCGEKSTQAIRMPTIEQVSKQLRTDPNWFTKCMLGVLLSFIPVVHFFACGYLYRLFLQGRSQKPLVLPEWDDWKGLFLDGLKFFLILLVFAGIPLGIMGALLEAMYWDSFWMRIPMAPIAFFAGPLASAALYMYLLDGNFRNCFSFDALVGLLKRSLDGYWAPTLAFLGITLMLPFAFFLGGVVYFYLMAYLFKNAQEGADRG